MCIDVNGGKNLIRGNPASSNLLGNQVLRGVMDWYFGESGVAWGNGLMEKFLVSFEKTLFCLHCHSHADTSQPLVARK